MKPIWITGAGGLIGHYLAESAARHAIGQFIPIGLSRRDLDLTNPAAVRKRFAADQPVAVIHCAAMSKGPDCQAQPDMARVINVEATRHLAHLAADIPLVFFSTDLVFDGRKGDYRETDGVHPLSVYAETKVAAEEIVLKNPRHTVVRTSLNYGRSPGRSRPFNEDMLEQWRTGRSVNLFVDEYRSPIAAAITARTTWELLKLGRPGLYHLAGSERLSRYEIGRLIAARHPELQPRIEPGFLRDFRGAPRSPDTTLNCGKLQALLSYPLPDFSAWLRDSTEY